MIVLLQKVRRYLRMLIVLAGLIMPVTASANIAMMPLDDVKAGMRGIGKTVVSGTNVENFDVEVLGVMKNKGPSGDLILVRVSGDVIDRTGGIAEGMSGSPVYIDNQLVGAISFGWKLSDHRVGMVTPIQDMIRLWELPDPVNTRKTASSFLMDDDIKPLNTPIMASGFSPRGLEMLTEKLKPFNMVPYASGEMPLGAAPGELQPGSAVGIELVRGDIGIGALGTVTHLQDEQVLAFGHPFLKKGNVNFLMSNAYIFTTIQGLQTPFKVGATGNLIGTVNQDRGAGVAGKLNTYPGIIPMMITVKDMDLNREKSTVVQIVQDEQLSPVLSETLIFNSVDQTIDRTGSGTARIQFSINGRNLPGEGTIKRENMFYHPTNIAASITEEFFQAMAMLSLNTFQHAEVMDIQVSVEMEQERRTAAIREARVLQHPVVYPGDIIPISVTLRPYRGKDIIRVATYTVPKNQKPGPMVLQVRGGATVPLIQLLMKQQGLGEAVSRREKNKHATLEILIQDFDRQDRNNDIVVEVYDPSLEESASQTAAAAKKPAKVKTSVRPTSLSLQKQAGRSKPTEKNATTVDYIVEGETQVLVQVAVKP